MEEDKEVDDNKVVENEKDDNVIELGDNIVESIHMDEEELRTFNKMDKDMEVKNLLVQNNALKIQNLQLHYEKEHLKLDGERVTFTQLLETHRKEYETFLQNIAEKYNIKSFKKMGIDPMTGSLKDFN